MTVGPLGDYVGMIAPQNPLIDIVTGGYDAVFLSRAVGTLSYPSLSFVGHVASAAGAGAANYTSVVTGIANPPYNNIMSNGRVLASVCEINYLGSSEFASGAT